MSWLWGSSTPSQDATKNLDPSLRDFLDKETRQATTTTQVATPPSTTTKAYRPQVGFDKPGITHLDQYKPVEEAPRDAVLSESQFKDGRYAHLWKNYRSPEEVAAASFTDQDKIHTVLENFRERKTAIKAAALANCAIEQLEEQECWKSGSWSRLMGGCRQEGKAFTRCFSMQARFLKALGYLSMPRNAEEEERIQMHADKLYQDMLKREKMLDEARDKGVDAPPTEPLIRADETLAALGQDSAWARIRQEAIDHPEKHTLKPLSPEENAQLQARLKKMSDHERTVELQLMAAENRAAKDFTDKYAELRKQQQEPDGILDRLRRYASGS